MLFWQDVLLGLRDEYLKGNLNQIEELEETRLHLNGSPFHSYSRIVTSTVRI